MIGGERVSPDRDRCPWQCSATRPPFSPVSPIGCRCPTTKGATGLFSGGEPKAAEMPIHDPRHPLPFFHQCVAGEPMLEEIPNLAQRHRPPPHNHQLRRRT
jgi:hypothetical protein